MSFINVEYKNMFIHIPKCAGSSMEHLYFVGGNGHINFYNISKESNFNPNFIKWAFIRNPYTRIASAYYGTKIQTYVQKKMFSESKTFKDFVLNLYKFLPEKIDYKIKYELSKQFYHILPLNYFINHDQYKLDFIGKYENLQEDWKKLTNLLKVDQQLPHLNATKNKKDYMSLYDEEMKKVIKDIYKDDFNYYKE